MTEDVKEMGVVVVVMMEEVVVVVVVVGPVMVKLGVMVTEPLVLLFAVEDVKLPVMLYEPPPPPDECRSTSLVPPPPPE